MPLTRAVEKLFNFPKLYRAKFAITGALVSLVKPYFFKTLVTIDDMVRAAAISAGSTICEIGCGDGENYKIVTAIAGDVDYTGVDINQSMVKHCVDTFPAQAWCVATPPYAFADGAFDFCLIANVLHHLDSEGATERMLSEARRIAKTVLLFEPLQSEHPALYATKRFYWALTDGGNRYLRLAEFHSLFEKVGMQVTWERYSSPLRHFYGAHLTGRTIQ